MWRSGSAAPDCTITTRSTARGGGCGAPAGECPAPGRRDSRRARRPRAPDGRCRRPGVRKEKSTSSADQHHDQRPGPDRDRDAGRRSAPRRASTSANASATPSTAPEAPTKGPTRHDAGEQPGEKTAAPDATIQVVEDECPAAHPALDRGAEHEQHQHVGEQVQQARVDEHVGEEGPRLGERRRRERRLERRRPAPAR